MTKSNDTKNYNDSEFIPGAEEYGNQSVYSKMKKAMKFQDELANTVNQYQKDLMQNRYSEYR
jgi:hypothetical protein